MARDKAPLAGLDLNLLVTLRALLREASVTRAAARLGQSQPSVSRALGTLRSAFDDPLLVRSGRGMLLTPRAESLRVPLERTLASLDRLQVSGTFDPIRDERVFRILMPDVLGTLVVPRLMERVEREAPGLILQVLGSERDMLRALLEDEIDVVVAGPILEHPELYTRRVGAALPWSVLFGPAHPEDSMDLERWLAADHVMLSPHGRPDVPSRLAERLADLGLERIVRLHVGYLPAICETLLRTSMVTSLPTPMARHLADRYPMLREAPHPMKEMPALEARMTWHEAQHADDGHVWLRRALGEAVEEALGR